MKEKCPNCGRVHQVRLYAWRVQCPCGWIGMKDFIGCYRWKKDPLRDNVEIIQAVRQFVQSR